MPVGFYYAPPLLQHKNVTIYGIHVDDHSNKRLRKTKFGFSKYASDEGQDTFDLKDLCNFQEDVEPIKLIIEAIDNDWLTSKGVNNRHKLTSNENVAV